jgi:sulfur-oxidizing protein SoxY
MTNLSRRGFLKGTLATGAATVLPFSAMADWPKAAFEAKTVEDAIMALLGSPDTLVSSAITIEVPEIAENGAVVPVKVNSTLPKVESIVLISKKNPIPLIAHFKFESDAVQPFVATRIKMGETSNVVAVLKSEGKLYVARKEVKVTIGGCGG